MNSLRLILAAYRYRVSTYVVTNTRDQLQQSHVPPVVQGAGSKGMPCEVIVGIAT